MDQKESTAFPIKKVIITSNKAVPTQPDGTANILIDDYGPNVAKWESQEVLDLNTRIQV